MRPSRPRPVLSGCCLLALAAAAQPLPAQRLLDWRAQRAGTAAVAPADTGAVAGGGNPWLQLERHGAAYQVWAANPLPGPVQVRLAARAGAGYAAVPALPRILTLQAHERRRLTELYPVAAAAAGPLDLWLDAVPGAPGAQARDMLYRLPFAPGPVHVDQGFGGRFSHHDAGNRYALDFALPQGTPVLAARDGRVLQVETGEDRAPSDGGGNLVRVLHDDGSMALYAHLAPGGVDVRPGQAVRAGQGLGRSGSTGFSTAPHLHFAIQLNGGMQLVSVPFRIAGPLGELRFPRTGGPGP